MLPFDLRLHYLFYFKDQLNNKSTTHQAQPSNGGLSLVGSIGLIRGNMVGVSIDLLASINTVS